MSDDNQDCSVILVNSSVGRVAENRSLGLTVYADRSEITNHVSFYADNVKINATGCTFRTQLINQLHSSNGQLLFTNCTFAGEESVFDTVFDADIVVQEASAATEVAKALESSTLSLVNVRY